MCLPPPGLPLDRLCQGNSEALAEVFEVYVPYLTAVARRMIPTSLRSRVDAEDIVQTVWASLLSGFRTSGWHFVDANQLLHFLIKVTRNRCIDWLRQERRGGAQSMEGLPGGGAEIADAVVCPLEMMEADDLWQSLLKAATPTQRQVLHLKREGESLDGIARRTGLHKSSVRRILYELYKVAIRPTLARTSRREALRCESRRIA